MLYLGKLWTKVFTKFIPAYKPHFKKVMSTVSKTVFNKFKQTFFKLVYLWNNMSNLLLESNVCMFHSRC